MENPVSLSPRVRDQLRLGSNDCRNSPHRVGIMSSCYQKVRCSARLIQLKSHAARIKKYIHMNEGFVGALHKAGLKEGKESEGARLTFRFLSDLIMSGKCQRFGHSPQFSPDNLHYILHTFSFRTPLPHFVLD